MPRRNRNASTRPITTDDNPATEIGQLATELAATHALTLLCAGCLTSPAAGGDHCLPCKGQIISSARKTTLKRR